MNTIEQQRFDRLYAEMLQALKLQGKRGKTIDGYARAVRCIAGYFDCCPDSLTAEDLKIYFVSLLELYSWSTIKVDLWGLKFLHRFILKRPMEWIEIIKPTQVQSLPDIPTREETLRLINTVRCLRYRVYFFTVCSMCLRLGEALQLEVGDIDGERHRVHIREGKGGKDRYVQLPVVTLLSLRKFWKIHRHPNLLFSSPNVGGSGVRQARTPMDRSGVQGALKAAMADL